MVLLNDDFHALLDLRKYLMKITGNLGFAHVDGCHDSIMLFPTRTVVSREEPEAYWMVCAMA